MDNQQAKQIMDMGWLVGFLEGEGCFSLQKNAYGGKRRGTKKATIRPRISVSSCDKEYIERCAEIFNSIGVGAYFLRKRYTHKKDQYELSINGLKRCKKFVDQIIPYMTDSRRRNVAETLQEYCNYRLSLEYNTPYGEREFALWQRIRDLNGYHLRQSLRDSTRDVFDYNTKVESAVP